MTLEELGYNNQIEDFRKNNIDNSFAVARVISEHKERYIVRNTNEYEAEITGNLRYSTLSRSDFPAVGDWVSISEYDDNKALIHNIFPRRSIIERQAVGKQGEKQIIATNIDFAFIMQAVDRDFNINRIERYLTICNSSNITPIIILNKIDLIGDEELSILIEKVRKRVKEVQIIAISNISEKGYEVLSGIISKGSTYCLLGSSGVGKSTLLNTLSGKNKMKTDVISSSNNKGRHVTTHREMIVLRSGGILIDNPGMREVGIADSTEGIDITFDEIYRLSSKCRFKDCSHTDEVDCAVTEALTNGELDHKSYENYLKIEREKDHYESTVAERRKKDKDFGKMIKNVKRSLKNTKY